MQQCQYGALILMFNHFAQHGREPVNPDVYWRGSLYQHAPASHFKYPGVTPEGASLPLACSNRGFIG